MQLIGDYDGPHWATPWPEVVGGLDTAPPSSASKPDDALADALAGLDPRERPWTMWSVENPRYHAFAEHKAGASATLAVPSKRRSPRERTIPARTRPREMSTAELLQIAEDSR